ncbi:MAG: hypothetical protein LBV77_01825 [Candidatus Adiutrix intracellularis]|nr:hypothetical protein [Candidatus Adiutrix intracellularis]
MVDDPTGDLNKTNDRRILNILHQLHRKGSTIVLVTYVPKVAAHTKKNIALEYNRIARFII